jgi:hypothetical protein
MISIELLISWGFRSRQTGDGGGGVREIYIIFMVSYELLHLQFQFMDLWRVIVAGVDPWRLRPSSALEISNQFMIRPDRRCAGAVPCTYNRQDSACSSAVLRLRAAASYFWKQAIFDKGR